MEHRKRNFSYKQMHPCNPWKKDGAMYIARQRVFQIKKKQSIEYLLLSFCYYLKLNNRYIDK